MKIELRELFGVYCLHYDQGRKLSLMLEATMKLKEGVTLDCFGIRIITGDFLEGAFSKLLIKYKKNTLMSRLRIKSAKRYVENSIKFNISFIARYNNDKDFKKIIDKHFNPISANHTIKDLEVLPIEIAEETEAEETEAEKPLYSVERMDVQSLDQPTSCHGNCSN